MNIALIGPPGCGKRTNAQALAEVLKAPRASCGNLFRQQLMDRTALGLLARKYMERGELVPDEVVDAMLEEWVLRHTAEEGMVLDGFPRTLYQANFLEGLMEQRGTTLDVVIYLDIPDDEATVRMSNRMNCPRCQTTFNRKTNPPKVDGVCNVCGTDLVHREDDTADLIAARLRTFHRTVRPIIETYQAAGKLVLIDAREDLAGVRNRLVEVMDEVKAGRIPLLSDEEAAGLLERAAEGPAPALKEHAGLDLILLGAPGSGKGTQAETLCKELSLPHIATGDLFRDNLKRQTDLGRMARTYMDRGELVPDEVTDAMVKDRLGGEDTERGYVLDGYPRNLHQAQALSDMEQALHRHVSGVLYIKVSDEQIVERLSGRWICRECQTPYHLMFKPPALEGVCDTCGGELYQRDDDNPETVRSRLKTFHAKTEPLIDYYKKVGVLHEVKGEGKVSEISERCLAIVRDEIMTTSD